MDRRNLGGEFDAPRRIELPENSTADDLARPDDGSVNVVEHLQRAARAGGTERHDEEQPGDDDDEPGERAPVQEDRASEVGQPGELAAPDSTAGENASRLVGGMVTGHGAVEMQRREPAGEDDSGAPEGKEPETESVRPNDAARKPGGEPADSIGSAEDHAHEDDWARHDRAAVVPAEIAVPDDIPGTDEASLAGHETGRSDEDIWAADTRPLDEQWQEALHDYQKAWSDPRWEPDDVENWPQFKHVQYLKKLMKEELQAEIAELKQQVAEESASLDHPAEPGNIEDELKQIQDETLGGGATSEYEIHRGTALPPDLPSGIRTRLIDDEQRLNKNLSSIFGHKRYVNGHDLRTSGYDPAHPESMQNLYNIIFQRAGAAINGGETYGMHEIYIDGLRNHRAEQLQDASYENSASEEDWHTEDRLGQPEPDYERLLEARGIEHYLNKYQDRLNRAKQAGDKRDIRRYTSLVERMTEFRNTRLQEAAKTREMPTPPAGFVPVRPDQADTEVPNEDAQTMINDITHAQRIAGGPHSDVPFIGTPDLANKPLPEIKKQLKSLRRGLLDLSSLSETPDSSLVIRMGHAKSSLDAAILKLENDPLAHIPLGWERRQLKRLNELRQLWPNVQILELRGIKTLEGAAAYYQTKLEQIETIKYGEDPPITREAQDIVAVYMIGLSRIFKDRWQNRRRRK